MSIEPPDIFYEDIHFTDLLLSEKPIFHGESEANGELPNLPNLPNSEKMIAHYGCQNTSH